MRAIQIERFGDPAQVAAAATRNPWARSFALLTYGMAYCEANPSAHETPCAMPS